jgi:hypothetical protein
MQRRYLPTEEDLEYLRKHGRPRQRVVPSYDFYFIGVGNRLVNLFNALWKMEASIVFLRQFPYKRTLTNYGISRADYIKYHLESYYISVASGVDRVGLLVNDVFELGLPARLAKIQNVISMDQLKNTKVSQVLKDLNKGLQKFRELKNYVAHEGELEDPDIAVISRYSLFSSQEAPLSEVQRISSVLLGRIYLGQKRAELRRLNAKIEEMLIRTFDELLPIYERRTPIPDNVRKIFLQN